MYQGLYSNNDISIAYHMGKEEYRLTSIHLSMLVRLNAMRAIFIGADCAFVSKAACRDVRVLSHQSTQSQPFFNLVYARMMDIYFYSFDQLETRAVKTMIGSTKRMKYIPSSDLISLLRSLSISLHTLFLLSFCPGL